MAGAPQSVVAVRPSTAVRPSVRRSSQGGGRISRSVCRCFARRRYPPPPAIPVPGMTFNRVLGVFHVVPPFYFFNELWLSMQKRPRQKCRSNRDRTFWIWSVSYQISHKLIFVQLHGRFPFPPPTPGYESGMREGGLRCTLLFFFVSFVQVVHSSPFLVF